MLFPTTLSRKTLPAVVSVLSERIARQYHVFPLREDGRRVIVATADPTNFEAEHAIGFATGRRVVAGPVEATALGNIMVQAVATGHLQDLDAGRKAIEASAHLETFDPQPSADWDEAFLRFQFLLRTGSS